MTERVTIDLDIDRSIRRLLQNTVDPRCDHWDPYGPAVEGQYNQDSETVTRWLQSPVPASAAGVREALIAIVMKHTWGVEDGEDAGSVMPRRAGAAVDELLAALGREG